MPRKKSPTLTEAETPLMDILWARGAATVNEVVDALPSARPLAYNTVLTTLRILEQKGFVRHTKDGRAFVYQAAVKRGEAQESAVSALVQRFFGNSPEALAQHLFQSEEITPETLARLRKTLSAKMKKKE